MIINIAKYLFVCQNEQCIASVRINNWKSVDLIFD